MALSPTACSGGFPDAPVTEAAALNAGIATVCPTPRARPKPARRTSVVSPSDCSVAHAFLGLADERLAFLARLYYLVDAVTVMGPAFLWE